MKVFLSVVVLLSVMAAVSANMYGANNALNKRFPGSRPMSVNEYINLVNQERERRRPVTTRPNPDWMFEPNPQSVGTPVSRFPQDSLYPRGVRRPNPRPRVPSGGIFRRDSDELDLSREDD